MQMSTAKKASVGTALIGGSLLLLGVEAPAFTQGPQYWGVDSTSGRFRHDASQVVVGSPDCTSNTLAPYTAKVNLRVDIKDDPDESRGTITFLCGESATYQNGRSSENTDRYRGHFLQVRSYAVYGTLNAK
jgi:hypothetical protein